MQAKFKVGDHVRIKESMCIGSVREYVNKTAIIIEVIRGRWDFNGISYRYQINLGGKGNNKWHPSYFELIPPPAKYRRIRL